MRKLALTLFLVGALTAAAVPALAQQTTGTIVGTVVDQSGAVLPGVTVICKHLTTGRTYEFVTSATGVYTASLLPVGEYEITFKLAGFQDTVAKGIQLHVNDRQEIGA